MNQEMTVVDLFKRQITSQNVHDNLRSFLPSGKEGDAMMQKFTAVTIRAVQEKPELLAADRKSLFLACQRATQDGLMPDNREGALVMFGNKVQWQPMIYGIRKKLTQAGFDLRAEIVYENDFFEIELGDEPGLTHKPMAFGKRGEIIGAYAIATDLKTGDKYRETMDIAELEKVRLSSRGKDSPAWSTWTTEMYRKTVAKRLKKYLPISDDTLLDMIDRDNEEYDMDAFPGKEPSSVARKVQDAVRAANSQQNSDAIEGTVEPAQKPKPKMKPKKNKVVEPEGQEPDTQEPPQDEAPPPDNIPEDDYIPAAETDPLDF